MNKATGQPVPRAAFKTLNVANALPQSFISGLIQDSTDFILDRKTERGWQDMTEGNFKVFQHLPVNTAAMSDNTDTKGSIIKSVSVNKGEGQVDKQ